MCNWQFLYLLIPIEIIEKWIDMGRFGKTWEVLGRHGKIREDLGRLGTFWEDMGRLGKISKLIR